MLVPRPQDTAEFVVMKVRSIIVMAIEAIWRHHLENVDVKVVYKTGPKSVVDHAITNKEYKAHELVMAPLSHSVTSCVAKDVPSSSLVVNVAELAPTVSKGVAAWISPSVNLDGKEDDSGAKFVVPMWVIPFAKQPEATPNLAWCNVKVELSAAVGVAKPSPQLAVMIPCLHNPKKIEKGKMLVKPPCPKPKKKAAEKAAAKAAATAEKATAKATATAKSCAEHQAGADRKRARTV